MSPEMLRTGDKPSPSLTGEGRREEAPQQSEPAQRSGGVSVDSTSVSSVRESWENCGGGGKTQPNAQAGRTSEAGGVVGEVGVPHSSVDLFALDAAYRQELRAETRRGDTCSMRGGEAKDAGMAGTTRIATPDKVRQLQIALYRKAKAEPK
jgi:hypothetical protein